MAKAGMFGLIRFSIDLIVSKRGLAAHRMKFQSAILQKSRSMEDLQSFTAIAVPEINLSL
ncbi:MAG: hypothetical protein A2Y81_08435 [Nitrospirae bacterium RBG_13_43_8]|nr:MAG: hypothetical protein A2Y81_08435 [Nitrospirae bacterium RBG_13_43_8]